MNLTNKDFKKYLQYLSPEDEIHSIDTMLHQFYRSNPSGENLSKRFRIINELKKLRKKAIISFTKDFHNNSNH